MSSTESIAETLKETGQSSGTDDDAVPGVRATHGEVPKDAQSDQAGGHSPSNWSRYGSGAGHSQKKPDGSGKHEQS